MCLPALVVIVKMRDEDCGKGHRLFEDMYMGGYVESLSHGIHDTTFTL